MNKSFKIMKKNQLKFFQIFIYSNKLKVKRKYDYKFY